MPRAFPPKCPAHTLACLHPTPQDRRLSHREAAGFFGPHCTIYCPEKPSLHPCPPAAVASLRGTLAICRFVHMDAPPHTSLPHQPLPQQPLPDSPDTRAEARVHDELRAIARSVLKGRQCPGLLQTTALVHEAWMRLRGFDLSRLDSRSSKFAALAAKTLRSVLVDEARHEVRVKRGGNWRRLEIATNDIEGRTPLCAVDLLCLDEAMQELATLNQREATVVELRFFGGLTIDQVAEHMGFSARTIETDWEHARAWLRVRLDGMTRGS